MQLHLKVGTLPQCVYQVNVRKPPKVGQVIHARPINHGAKWFHCRVDEVKESPALGVLYFVSL